MRKIAIKIISLEKQLKEYTMIMSYEGRVNTIKKLELFKGLLKGLKNI